MKAKKSLGQNFFINKNLCTQIIDTVIRENPDLIVEIGPGKGSFTEFLYNTNIKTLLVEKDDELATELKQRFPNCIVVNEDFLDWDYKELEAFKDKEILFFGSLPYNVSKPIIRKIIESEYFKKNAYFIVQKEVAEKYIAKEPNNNLLALQTHLYSSPKRILNISPESFNPRPKVNSSFIVFQPIKDNYDIDLRSFKNFLKNSFTQPRKTLRNNLKHIEFNKKENTEKLLRKRPQHLSLEEYISLYNNK